VTKAKTHRPVVILEGGLGNQLFQYAFALYAGEGVPVLDDRRRFQWGDPLARVLKPGTWRRVRQSELLRAWQCPRVPRWQRDVDRYWQRAFDRRISRSFVVENGAFGEVEPVECGRIVFYEGYFQNERYAAARKDRFLRGLCPELLEPHPSFVPGRAHVAISLRLGDDYQKFGVRLPDDYYRAAIVKLVEGLRNPAVHVCADDGAEAIALLRGVELGCDIVDHSSAGVVDQLRAMATAPRIAIANSSFSWWGAWLGDALGRGDNRVVLCPEHWLAGPDTVAPSRWTRTTL
jgi:hypothetical protein